MLTPRPKRVYTSGASKMFYHPVHGYGFIGDSFKKITRLIQSGGSKLVKFLSPGGADKLKKIAEEKVKGMIESNPTAKQIVQHGKQIVQKSIESSPAVKEHPVGNALTKVVKEQAPAEAPKKEESFSDLLARMLKEQNGGSGLKKGKGKKAQGKGLFLPGTSFGSGLINI